jgi:hypothetical protein
LQCPYIPDSNIYADSLNSGLAGHTVAQDWKTINWGVVGSVNFASTTNPRSGSKNIQVMFNNYGGLQLSTGLSIRFSLVTGVTFWIRAESALTSGIDFSIGGDNNVASSTMRISPTTSWMPYNFTFSTYAASMNNVILLTWQSAISGNTPNIYIDDVNFVMSPGINTYAPSTISPSPTNSADILHISFKVFIALVILYVSIF